MPEQTTGHTLGEVVRSLEDVKTELREQRHEFNQRLDALNDRAVPMDRYQDRNLAIEEKLATALTTLATTSAKLEAAITAERTRAEAAEKELHDRITAVGVGIDSRLDKEKAERMGNLKWIAGFLIPAVITSLLGLLGIGIEVGGQ